jgi:methyl-accepting chemotaxis protein
VVFVSFSRSSRQERPCWSICIRLDGGLGRVFADGMSIMPSFVRMPQLIELSLEYVINFICEPFFAEICIFNISKNNLNFQQKKHLIGDVKGKAIGRKRMKLKELWSKTNKWILSRAQSAVKTRESEIDNEGLIREDVEGGAESAVQQAEKEVQAERPEEQVSREETGSVVVASSTDSEKAEPIEKLQRGFNRLIDRLANINDNLNLQVSQHKELIGRLDKMPELVKSFPTIVENQEKIRTQLAEQISAMAASNEQFIESVEKIPEETARQTGMLEEIRERLESAAEIDSRMSESFRQFNDILGNLDRNTISHTDSIMQMSKTFATSDRYLKYIISRQNKRFMWLFVISLSICVLVILALAGVIIYIGR